MGKDTEISKLVSVNYCAKNQIDNTIDNDLNKKYNKNNISLSETIKSDLLLGDMVESIYIGRESQLNPQENRNFKYSNESKNIEIENSTRSIYDNYLEFLKSKNDFFSLNNNKTFELNNIFEIKDRDEIDNLLKKECFIYKISENIGVIFAQGILTLQCSEMRPFYFRKIFSEEIFELLSLIPILSNIRISELKSDSWFSIHWNPYKSSKSVFNNTSFITFFNLENLLKHKNTDKINGDKDNNFKRFIPKANLPTRLQKDVFMNLICILIIFSYFSFKNKFLFYCNFFQAQTLLIVKLIIIRIIKNY